MTADKLCLICQHPATIHAGRNGESHPGETSTGVCGCVLSRDEVLEGRDTQRPFSRPDTRRAPGDLPRADAPDDWVQKLAKEVADKWPRSMAEKPLEEEDGQRWIDYAGWDERFGGQGTPTMTEED